MKKLNNGSRQILAGFLVLGVFALIGIVFVLMVIQPNDRKTESGPRSRYSDVELRARYDYVLDHVSKTNVHPFLRAIHFGIGNHFACSGTLMLKRDGAPDKIITAAHLFSETQPGSDYYDYRLVSPTGYVAGGHVSRVILDSICSKDSGGIHDIAICELGDRTLISRTSKVRVSADKPFDLRFAAGKIAPRTATSIATGEQHDITGQIVTDDGVPFFIMLYESLNGESGSGFWGSDGKLYIVSGDVDVTDSLRKDLGVPDQYKVVTAMAGVALNW